MTPAEVMIRTLDQERWFVRNSHAELVQVIINDLAKSGYLIANVKVVD